MTWLRHHILDVIAAAIAAALSVLSYQYLAIVLFYHGLNRFYSVAAEVPTQCSGVVSDAVVAFTSIFDVVALIAAALFLSVACYFAWRIMRVPLGFHTS